MAASLLSDAAALALRVAFGRAMQRHAPAFLLHGATAAPARSRVLDAVVGVLVDTVIGLRAAVLVVALAVLLFLLVLFASCLVAALSVIILYVDRARASSTRERRLPVLAFVSLFLLMVAVALMVVLILAIPDDGEE